MEEIIQEKISADHLLYVSLKYTKTCDVILNLILRWRIMIGVSIDEVLESAKKSKKISEVPNNPLGKIQEMRKLFKKDEEMQKVLDTYEMFRKIEELKKERIGEFRKNVTLKVSYKGEEISVNLEKLKEYAEMLEKFISKVKQFLLSKK
jgi:proteasome assembly chaperone (PAC2) family protein